MLLLSAAGYGKNLVSQGVQFLPRGLVPQSRGTKLEGKGGATSRAQESRTQQQEVETETAEEIKLDKSNIILLGPTGCGESWVEQIVEVDIT